MQQTIGNFIRQLRRQQNITQTNLGGARFSKSYVSAVERDKITASPEALSFFAEQLHQSSDYFTSLPQYVVNEKQLAVVNGSGALNVGDAVPANEALALFDMLLESTELNCFPPENELPSPAPEFIAALPRDKRARYYFLMGLNAKKKQNFSASLSAFEYALVLASLPQQPAILDELGMNYYLKQAYQTALGYHQRALSLLQEVTDVVNTRLRCKVELHCGEDYRALGAYKQARKHYEQARSYLSAEHDMQTAALLYIGLGYCMYATIHQRTALSLPMATRATFEEMEREFQRAASFLMQARSIYQVSGNRIREAAVCLTLAMVLLDFCTRQRQMLQEKVKAPGRQKMAACTSLLSETEQQCRQVLLAWQDFSDRDSIPAELDTTVYMSLAYLVRVMIQRATLARLGGYADTALRERSMAFYLCQQTLDSLTKGALPWAVMRNALALQAESTAYQVPSLPRLPAMPYETTVLPHNPISQAEVYFAAGEVAEELGRLATTEEYGHACYACATQCFQEGLRMACSVKEYDQSYVVRCYQRCICFFEERMLAVPDLSSETTRVLADLLEEGFTQLQHSVLLSAYS